jgi:hypothetical protein
VDDAPMIDNILIAVKSCVRDETNGIAQAARDTWGVECGRAGVPVLHFVGKPGHKREDVVSLECDDDYEALPYKTRSICRWILSNHECRGAFFCDADTYLVPSYLLKNIDADTDYYGKIWADYKVGKILQHFVDARGHAFKANIYPWASGGIGYYLSRRAMGYLAAQVPSHWAEDLWTGQVMGDLAERGEIRVQNDNFLFGAGAVHFCMSARGRDVVCNWMRDRHAEFKTTGKATW